MRTYATSVRVPHVQSHLHTVSVMMSDCQVKDARGRREVMVFSASEDLLILHLHVSVFVSDISRLFVNLYSVANGREEMRRVTFYTTSEDNRALTLYTTTEGKRGVTFYTTLSCTVK